MNIPDTMNDARIRAMVEPYGALVKVILRPDHQGAIVEFVDVNDAGKASLALEGVEVEAGRKIRVGDVGEMLKMAPETRTDRIVVGGGGGGAQKGVLTDKSGPSKASLQPTAFIRRPGNAGAGAGRGRRGGLGFSSRPRAKDGEKEGGGEGEQKDTDGVDGGPTAAVDAKEDGKAKKSNQDFRAMILGGK
jgi:squamous cell carcinoma antigen recognized by T-cells 3